MLGPSPWHRLRRGAILIGIALVFLPAAYATGGHRLLKRLPGRLGEPATYTLALGLIGALHIAAALNPAPGRGRGPDLR